MTIEWKTLWEHKERPYLAVQSAPVQRNGRSWTHHRFVNHRQGAGIAVVPIYDGGLIFVRQWRPVIDEVLLELPRGFALSPDPIDDSRRELLEETGFSSSAFSVLGRFILDSGLMPTPIVAVSAWIDSVVERQGTDREVDDVVLIPDAQVPELITKGTICDGITLAALALYRNRFRDVDR